MQKISLPNLSLPSSIKRISRKLTPIILCCKVTSIKLTSFQFTSIKVTVSPTNLLSSNFLGQTMSNLSPSIIFRLHQTNLHHLYTSDSSDQTYLYRYIYIYLSLSLFNHAPISLVKQAFSLIMGLRYRRWTLQCGVLPDRQGVATARDSVWAKTQFTTRRPRGFQHVPTPPMKMIWPYLTAPMERPRS